MKKTLALLSCLSLLAWTPAPAKADFKAFKRSLWPEARSKGITETTFQRAMNGVELNNEIIRLSRKQPEFFDSIGVYVERRVSEARINRGRELRRQYADLLEQIEQTYGVDGDMVLSVWGMETNFGTYTGEHEVVEALATLAYSSKRKDFFRKELLTALTIIQQEGFNPAYLKGSWAGAMGHTQFMPTSYRMYAVDGDGNGRRDIWKSIPDALASTANYLKKHGWETGKTWGYEVLIPEGKAGDRLLTQSKQPISAWASGGVERANGQPFPRGGTDSASLNVPAGLKGPAFLFLKNFDVIRTYNNSKAYALAVGHLADRIAGGEAFSTQWPNAERISLKMVEEIQSTLKEKGYYKGEVDGRPGLGTEEAIRAYQAEAGLPADGQPTSRLLQELRKN